MAALMMPPTATPSDAIEPHRPALWGYLRMLGCDRVEADDLAQEALLAALGRDLGDWEAARVLGYLRSIARNKFIDMLRRRGREISVESLDAAEAAWQALTPDEAVDARQEALRHCLDQLTPRARNAIELVYHHDSSGEQAARALGISTDAVKGLLKRARALLRECVSRRIA